MLLLGVVFELVFELVFGIVFEIGLLIFPGTGHLLVYLFTGGRAYRGRRCVGDGMASLIGVAFWLLVAAAIAWIVLR